MQQTVGIPSAPSFFERENRPNFKVVIAYEDFETGKLAKHVYDFITLNLGSDCEFSNQMWKFDVLSVPKLREIATKDAFEADVLMISSRGGQGLAAGVQMWIESWLTQGTCAIALVALFGCEVQETHTIRAYLSEVARRGGLEFFAQPDHWPRSDNPTGEATTQWQQVRNGNISVPVSPIPTQVEPAVHWGLNE